MLKKMFTIMAVVTATLLTMFSIPYAAEKPEIIRHDATYLEKGVSIVVQWQSANPVTRVVISAGKEQKEIKVDEYDNRRNPHGYSGEVSALIPIEAAAGGFGPPVAPTPFQYTIQLEDDLRLRSDMIFGKVSPPVVAGGGMPPPPYGAMPPPGGMMPPPNHDDGWGQSHINTNVTTQQPQGGAAAGVGGIMDKLLTTMERHDTAPTMNKIKVNVLSPDTVSFTSKAVDDKGLREVKFKILDTRGMTVQEQVLSGLGKNWEGTSQTFQIGGGNFRVIAQAIDSAGNTSKEQSESFTLTGPPIAVQPQAQPTLQSPAVTPTPTYTQPPIVSSPPPVVAPPPDVIPQPPIVMPPPPIVPPPPPPLVTPPPPDVIPLPPVVVPPPPVVTPPPPDVMPPPPVVIPPPPVVIPPPPDVTPPPPVVVPPPPPPPQSDRRRVRPPDDRVSDAPRSVTDPGTGTDTRTHNARPSNTEPVDARIAECRANNRRNHAELVQFFQRTRSAGNISTSEAQAFTVMEDRLNTLSRNLNRGGLNLTECEILTQTIATERTKIQRMASESRPK